MCTNLVMSNRGVIDTTPSTVSAIMQHLGSSGSGRSGNNSLSSASSKSKTVAGVPLEVENLDGLVNFAPYGKSFGSICKAFMSVFLITISKQMYTVATVPIQISLFVHQDSNHGVTVYVIL